MSAVGVKICGITRLGDALAAVDAGADALGFNFYEGSPRYIHPEAARAIVDRLPPFVASVGVFVGESAEAVARVARASGITLVQLHGDEGPGEAGEVAEASGLSVIKALKITGPGSIEGARGFSRARALLLDGPGPGRGGGGVAFDWSLARGLCAERPVLIAGGLHPGNVAEAVRQARPSGVDVASGVETAPGQKSHEAVARFVAAAKGAFRAG